MRHRVSSRGDRLWPIKKCFVTYKDARGVVLWRAFCLPYARDRPYRVCSTSRSRPGETGERIFESGLPRSVVADVDLRQPPHALPVVGVAAANLVCVWPHQLERGNSILSRSETLEERRRRKTKKKKKTRTSPAFRLLLLVSTEEMTEPKKKTKIRGVKVYLGNLSKDPNRSGRVTLYRFTPIMPLFTYIPPELVLRMRAGMSIIARQNKIQWTNK